jgi:hypothetical protein
MEILFGVARCVNIKGKTLCNSAYQMKFSSHPLSIQKLTFGFIRASVRFHLRAFSSNVFCDSSAQHEVSRQGIFIVIGRVGEKLKEKTR